MKTKLISRLARTIPSLGVSILLLSQALADPLDNWTTNQVSTNSFCLDCVVYGNGRYVAYGEYLDWGVIMTSEDGINWALRLDGKTNSSGFSFSIALVYTGNRFFALGGFGASAVSTNGADWTAFSHYAIDPNGGLFTSVAYGNARHVMVGGGAYTSTDAVTWTAHPPQGGVVDIAFGASKFVAIGNPGHIYTSAIGSSWTDRPILGGNKISFCNGNFLVPYGPGTNLISSDGISWATVNTGITGFLGKVTFANGLFMSRAGVYLATSTDGTNWIQYPQALPGYQIATDGTRLVTVGGTYLGGPNPNSYNGYTYYSDTLVSVGITNTPPAQIVLSGLVGRSYRIEYVDALLSAGSNSWQTLTTLQPPSTPYLFTDTTATNSSQRFYRGVLLP